MPTTESSQFAQRLWARHTRYSIHAPHMQLARRIYRAHGDRMPLLTAVQRRWLPAESGPFGTKLALPYAQPPVSVGMQPLSMPAVQRSADASLASPRDARLDRSEASTTPTPIVTVQRADAAPLSSVTGLGGGDMGLQGVRPDRQAASALPLPHQVQRQASPQGAAAPITAIGRQMGTMAPTLPQALPTMTVPLPSPGTVQRSAVTPTPSGATPTGDLGAAIFSRHISYTPGQAIPAHAAGTAAGQMVYRAVALPTQHMDAGSSRPAPSMISSPAIQRRADTGPSGRQMALVETGVRPPISIMRAAASPTATARRSAIAGISPPASPVAATPALGMTIFQRHPATSVNGGQHGTGGRQGVVSGDQSRPSLHLVLQRFRQAPAGPDQVSRMGRAPVLPVARAVGQHAAISGFDRGQSLPLASAHTQTPLPLVTPLVHEQATSVQRQTDQQLANNSMTPTTNMPPAAGPSTPAEAATTAAEIDQDKASELAEIVWRKLMRRLAVEGERRGRQAWP